MDKPVIMITMGDPCGIGPEIILKALKNEEIYEICRPVIVGSFNVMEYAKKIFGSDLKFNQTNIDNLSYSDSIIDVINAGDEINNVEFGHPDKNTGSNVFSYITKAIDLCMQKKAHAIVTAPINKKTLADSDIHFNGHTEILATYSNTKEYAMMMYGQKLSVVLVTIHIPLSEVSSSITTQNIYKKIILTHDSLKKRFSINDPKIAVCGLNPHSGEEGLFGNEESTIIMPAIELARKEGISLSDPLPPDTAFVQAKKGKYDTVLCMYHDQGLIPFKLLHFEDGVNTTLGLPFPRTSVDHGTAYDIAGKNIADSLSLVQAIKIAAFQASNLKKYKKAL